MSSWRVQGQLLMWLTGAERQTLHLLRMNDTRIPNLAYEYTSTDRRNVARQRKIQKDQHPWRRNEPWMAYNLLLLLLLMMMVMMIIMIIIPALYLWSSRQHARTLFIQPVKHTHTGTRANVTFVWRPHGSGSQSPAFYRRRPCSIPGQFLWDLGRTKRQWDRFFPSTRFFPVSFIPILLFLWRCATAPSLGGKYILFAALVQTLEERGTTHCNTRDCTPNDSSVPRIS